MLFVLSPAKSLDYDSPATTDSFTQPEFLAQSESLVDILKDYTPDKLASLMKISDKLADLNVARFSSWEPNFNPDNAKQALLAFKGDVYIGLNASTIDDDGLDYAQTHLRILSGLYGILKPLDLMQPYRLEMGTKLNTEHGKNLYEFWGNTLQDRVIELLSKHDSPVLINLASKEYFTALRLETLPNRVITPTFKDWKNGQYKHINFYAKKARGLMARYAIDHQVTNVDNLKDFDYEGYSFSEELSEGDNWVFTRKLNP
ncbi:MAG: peroxide stress protein YaaA [Enterobacterales bacterium]|nr:peroxide stress protein YaaA [Enterobacterales bacterium]